MLRHCGSEAVTPAPPEGGGGGWSASAGAAERPGVAEAPEAGGAPAAGRSGTRSGAFGPGQGKGAEASASPRRDGERPARCEPRLRRRGHAAGGRSRRPCPPAAETPRAARPGPARPPLSLRGARDSSAAAALNGSLRERGHLDGLFVSCPGRSSRPPPPDAFLLPLLSGCRHCQRRLRLRAGFGLVSPGGFEERESFPLFDGIFLPCRNGLSLISSYFYV